MKRKVLFVIINLILFSSKINAEWNSISINDLVNNSDLIVLGTLNNCNSIIDNDKNVVKESGYISIEYILKGSIEDSQSIQLKWQNLTGLACPRIEHKAAEKKTGIWFLQKEKNKLFSANHIDRFVELCRYEKIISVFSLLNIDSSTKNEIIIKSQISNTIRNIYSDIWKIKKEYQQFSETPKIIIDDYSLKCENGVIDETKTRGTFFKKNGYDFFVNIKYPATKKDIQQLEGSPFFKLSNDKLLKYWSLVRAENNESGNNFKLKIRAIIDKNLSELIKNLDAKIIRK